MKSAQELAQHWGRRSVPFPRAELSEGDVPEETSAVLAAGVLPRSTAPFLSFGSQYSVGSKRRGWVPSVAEAFDLEDEAFENYGVIGTDGSASPVAVDLDSGAVVLLDHDAGFESQPVNGDVLALARCLVAFDHFVKGVEDELGKHGYIDGLYSAEHVDEIERNLAASDPTALDAGSFWARNLSKLRAEVG